MMLWSLMAFAEPTALDAAYQKEYAYLQAELDVVRSRRQQLSKDGTRRVQEAKERLSAARATTLSLDDRLNRREDERFALRATLDVQQEGVDRTASTLAAAAGSLPSLELPKDDEVRAFSMAFAAATRSLRAGQQVTSEPGSWFREDGTKVDGTVTRLGRIAAFGDGQPLAPAGEGRLVRVDGGSVFLFEGESKRAVPEEPKTWGDQLEAGGLVGWVILLLGLLGSLLAFARVLSLGQARMTADQRVVAALERGSRDFDELENRAAEALLRETPRIERFGAAILVIAAISPLLGLLGTVTGMIGTFEILTTHGTGDPRMLSGGISEALVTTQLGLIVAIPMLLVGNLLNRAGENLLGGLETTARATINRCSAPLQDDHEKVAAK